MDKQGFVVCFWMMFLLYLEGFCQKTKYHGTFDLLRSAGILAYQNFYPNSVPKNI